MKRWEDAGMKKLLLFILVVGGGIFIGYRFGLIGEGSSKPGPPDFTRAETAAEYFFKAAMDGNEAKIREVSVDANEETLLRAAANLRSAIPPEKRGSAFKWQNTLPEQGEDQAYTGKIGTTLFMIGLRSVGGEYRVCRLMAG
jgi:hypothetical protein